MDDLDRCKTPTANDFFKQIYSELRHNLSEVEKKIFEIVKNSSLSVF